MPQKETQQIDVKGNYSTAEVTHVLEALKLEGSCYLKNHFLMKASGGQARDAIREWHDNVTVKNLEQLAKCANEMGLALPFPKKLEDRENELKERTQEMTLDGLFTEGELIQEVVNTAMFIDRFYGESSHLVKTDDVRECFMGARRIVAENLVKLDKALEKTENYYPPPIAHKIGYVAEKGVPASTRAR